MAYDAFLKYGPTGLAGLMLVLVITALQGDITQSRERILRQFMYIGAGCFALALAANFATGFFTITGEYPLHFSVLPLIEGDPATRKLRPPIIKANGTIVNEERNMTYTVKSEVTAIVDVSDAINQLLDTEKNLSKATDTVSQVLSQMRRESERSAIAGVIAQIQVLMTSMSQGCSGGPNRAPVNWGTLQAQGNAAVNAFQDASVALAKGDMATVVQQITAGQASLNDLVNGAHNNCSGGADPAGYGSYQFTRATLNATLDALKPFLQ